MNRESIQFSNSTVILSIIFLVAGYGINPVYAQQSTDIIEAEFILADTMGGVGTTPGNTVLAKILRDVPTTSQLDEYFGWTGLQVEATGRFRTQLIDGYWYLIDPLGHPFFSVAPNSVNSYYPNVKMPDDLIKAGFNTLGNWSTYSNINSFSGPDMPYVTRFLFLQGYKNTTQRTKELYSDGVIAIFDAEFVTFAKNLALELTQVANDPYCIGIFSDNELPNYDNTTYGKLLDRFLAVEDSDPNYLAAHQWMILRKGEGYTIDETDREEFHGYLMGTYYRIVHEAIDEVAPDLLYLGSRLHGAAKYKPSLFREAGKYVDVISINFYGPYEPATTDIEMWLGESNKPFLISEYYAKGYDVGMANASGAGNNVPKQTDRAIYFENFTLKMLESRGCVGVQWHRFQDDINPYVNKGFINENGAWYVPLKSSLTKITKDMYGLRNYLTPIPEGKQAAIYIGPNFEKTPLYLPVGEYTQATITMLLGDTGQISSVKLKAGYKAVFFNGENLDGDSIEVFSTDGLLENNGLPGSLNSFRIALDYRLVVKKPLGTRRVYRSHDLNIDLNLVFELKGDESRALNHEIAAETSGGLFTTELSGSLLNINFNDGLLGEGSLVMSASVDEMVIFDTLNIIMFELPWNAPVKDSYIRGGDYNETNFGTESELLVKYSTTDNYHRIAYLAFKPAQGATPEAFNKVELVVHANSSGSSVDIGVYDPKEISWDELGLVWQNQPFLSGDAPVDVQHISTGGTYREFRWDISTKFSPERWTDGSEISLVLKSTQFVNDPVSILSVESGNQFASLDFRMVENVEQANLGNMTLYPNPAMDILNLGRVNGSGTTITGEVIGLQGNRLIQFTSKELQDGNLNIEELNSGIYFLQLNYTDRLVTKKFIKL
ncbi:MAG: DNRLRE domain-containing protein [Bacteroidales bacterium]